MFTCMRLYPEWLKKHIVLNENSRAMKSILEESALNTVCVSARCPNRGECFGRKTATFLILGNICTRQCRFCAITKGTPLPADKNEIKRIVRAVNEMKLGYVVITSVTRDDLPDGGAGHFHDIIIELRRQFPGIRVEVLIPDFQGNRESLETVLNARPDVLNHNVETIERLYPVVRPGADYRRSLSLLSYAKKYFHITAKSGIMLGMGEEKIEVVQTLRDLFRAGCDMLTIGQYLKPLEQYYPVKRFIPPQEFDYYREKAMSVGFRAVVSGPFVRSSYKAEECYNQVAEYKRLSV